MTTNEIRSAAAEGELPISPEELTALAAQLYAQIGPSVPVPAVVEVPQVPTVPTGGVPIAPRGGVPIAPPGGGPFTPPGGIPVTPPGSVPTAPPGGGPFTPPGSVPTASPVGFPGFDVPGLLVPPAPRGGIPDPTAATSAAHAAAGVGDVYNPLSAEVNAPAGTLSSSKAGAPEVPDLAAYRTGWQHSAAGSGVPSAAPEFYFLQPRPSAPGDAVGSAPRTEPDAPPRAPGVGDRSIVDNPHETFDVASVRADFPILAEQVNGHPLIWFDNAATTQKPRAVIDRLTYFYEHENSNIHRAAHELAARATDAYEDARNVVRRFIGASSPDEIIFVRGATEAINLVAQSWGRKHLRAGDEIVITHLEHHANIVPWQLIAQETGALLRVAPVDDAGNLLLPELERIVGPRTKLVAATQVSNALGTVTPVRQIVDIGHRYGARVLIDGAQSIPHIPIDVQELGADFFVFSGHKVYGPTGIGVLYGTSDALAETPPWQGGGNMIADVTLERSIFQGPPNKFEAGTGNIADAVGLGEALRYVERLGVERIAAYEHHLLEYATPRLAAIDGVRLVGTADEKASVLSFVLAGHDPVEVGKALNTQGIAVRAGHHCAQPILRRLGLEQTVRPSFALYNTVGEIDVFIDAVQRISDGTLVAG